MPREMPASETIFGFISTIESPEYGFFGGYLLVSLMGRPLEFHCTSPVQPNAAQQILYGPSLQPYLLGERISGVLLNAAKLKPQLVLTDIPPMMEGRSQSPAPMALLHPKNTGNEFASTACEITSTQPNGQIVVGGYELTLPIGYEDERHAVAELAAKLSEYVDLAEPFGRIHEAICEAQRIGGSSVDSHGQAA